jgi:hypothetical protein
MSWSPCQRPSHTPDKRVNIQFPTSKFDSNSSHLNYFATTQLADGYLTIWKSSELDIQTTNCYEQSSHLLPLAFVQISNKSSRGAQSETTLSTYILYIPQIPTTYHCRSNSTISPRFLTATSISLYSFKLC